MSLQDGGGVDIIFGAKLGCVRFYVIKYLYIYDFCEIVLLFFELFSVYRLLDCD